MFKIYCYHFFVFIATISIFTLFSLPSFFLHLLVYCVWRAGPSTGVGNTSIGSRFIASTTWVLGNGTQVPGLAASVSTT